MVEFVSHGAQAGLDVAEALAIGQLGEGHAEEVIPTGESLHAIVASIA